MLQGKDGLPLLDAPKDYRTDKDGLLVYDAEHQDGIVRRLREVIELIWKANADSIEQEACGILDMKSLQDYFRNPGI